MIKAVIDTAWRVISNAFDFWLNLLTGRWSDAWQNVKNALSAVWGGIVRIVLAGAKGVLRIVQSLANGIGGLLGADTWKGLDPTIKYLDSLSEQYSHYGEAASGAAKRTADANKAIAASTAKIPAASGGQNGSPLHPGKGSGGDSSGSDAAKDRLEHYRDTIRELTKDIAMLGKTQAWEQAIVERKYGEYKEFTNLEWQNIYALITKKERLEAVAEATEKAKEKLAELTEMLHAERLRHIELSASTEEDRISIEKFGKVFKDVTDQRVRAVITAIAAQQRLNSVDEKAAEVSKELNRTWLDRVKTLQTAIGMVGLETDAEKLNYEITQGSLQNLAVLQKFYLVLLQQAKDAKEKELEANKQFAAWVAANNPYALMAKWALETKKSQEKDYPRYIAELDREFQKLNLTTRQSQVEAEMWAKFWMLGAAKVKEAVDKVMRNEDRKKQIQQYKELAQGMSEVFTNSLDTLFKRGFKGFFGSVLTGFRDMIGQMARDWLKGQIYNMIARTANGMSGVGGVKIPMAQDFRAGGGPVTGGKPYLVGERGPELFIPHSSGTVAANGTGGATHVNVTMHVHGVQDADSFRASKSQISAEMARVANRSMNRNR